MSAPIQLPYAQFMQHYSHIAEHYDLTSATQILYVPPHTVVHEPIHLHAHEQLCIIADEYAQVCIISDQTNIQNPIWGAVRLYAHHNASITYTVAYVGSGEHSIELFLLGRGASITCNGLYGITDTQRCIITTKQEHTVPGATSSVLIKGVVGGHAVAEYTGMITIAEPATQSDATQQAATLILSPHARARSVPSLQVLTNDVRCKHGSAVGQLDPDLLFYAQARGISHEQSKRMLLHGFLAQAAVHIPAELAPTILERILNIV
ncbi:MAG: SufD family Fe-S cluster assembly protein [Candidatus Babeliales bacterium]